MRRRRKAEGFNLAFLDIMSCGLGAVILVFMLVKHNVNSVNPESELLRADILRLELQETELQQTLEELLDTAQSESEKIAKLRAKVAQLRQSLKQQNKSLSQKKEQLAALKSDIKNRPIAQKSDLVEEDRGGEEQYLLGMKVEGRRIALLVDSSASMTDEKLIDIIRRKNGSAGEKQAGPKWQRTKRTIRWLLARVPRTSDVSVLSFSDKVQNLGGSSWFKMSSSGVLSTLYNKVDALVPSGATNLQKGLQAVKKLNPTDLYLITDGLPTAGESRYGSLNPFASCSSLLGKSNTITGECRVKLFRQTIKDTGLTGVTVNVILLPMEGDPDAINEYWGWAATTGGLLMSPAVSWP